MIHGKRVVVTMPAYNSAKMLAKTYFDIIAQHVVDDVIIVDDGSKDDTVNIARSLPNAHVIEHASNAGYGGNQKTCYQAALDINADIIIMVHPDYQYTPLLLPAIAGMIANDVYDCVLASRILCSGAVTGGMPLWKYAGNRVLTVMENLIIGKTALSEFHTGYRGFSRNLLETIDISRNSDGFVFDNEILAQIMWCGMNVGEISCPTSYHEDASSIGFWTSVHYGLGCLNTGLKFRLAQCGLVDSPLFPKDKYLIGAVGAPV